MSGAPAQPRVLTFLGAAGTVTGSKFLVETGGSRVLLDCGLFQGDREWRRRNWDELPFDPARLDAVVLTHAHLDHCGALPLLRRGGFGGPVLCTASTARLAAIVLRDAAHLQEEEARIANETGYTKHRPALPLFDTADAEKAIAQLTPVAHEAPTGLPGGGTVRLRRAGHILGSSFAELDLDGVRLLFSGDLGRAVHPLLLPPVPPTRADFVVVESTYGDRLHEPEGDVRLATAIRRTAERGGTCLLPAFAVDRTAVLLLTLARLEREGRIPELPVYLDSPMAVRALAVYRSAIRHGDPEIRPGIRRSSLAEPGRLRLMERREESERLNRPDRPCVVISASGMATGGRVLHHLAAQLPERRNAVILTGFQVPGTRGRALADGASTVKIHGRYVPVRAEVVSVPGFSAHADADEVQAWLEQLPQAPQTVFVVHGEPHASAALSSRLRERTGWVAATPRYRERVVLG